MTLSVIIPCHNEERTLEKLVRRVLSVDLGDTRKEILVVDDGSTDASYSIACALAEGFPGVIRVFSQPKCQGKGAALQRGFREATGDLVVIQDADLEYDPSNFRQMLELFLLPEVSVVFGSRRLTANPVSNRFYYSAVPLVTLLTYLLYRTGVSDQFTCYKMLRRDLLARIPLRERGFGVDAELIAKLFRLGVRVHEVPIMYSPRSRAEGKKVRFHDGLVWCWQLIKHRFTNPRAW